MKIIVEKREIFLQALDHVAHLGPNRPSLTNCSSRPDLAFVQGQAFGSEGKPRESNPYRHGTRAHEWFDAGMSNETDELCGR